MTKPRAATGGTMMGLRLISARQSIGQENSYRLGEQEKDEHHDERKPKEDGAQHAGPAIAFLCLPSLVEAEPNNEYRQGHQEWPQLDKKGRGPCGARGK